jgi:hypothetical protein
MNTGLRLLYLVCLAVCLLLSAGAPARALTVERLEDLTAGAVPVVIYVSHDNFTNEHVYAVKVLNKTGDPILAGTLVLVVSAVMDIAMRNILDRLAFPDQLGTTAGKPYFRVPVKSSFELLPFQESEPIYIRFRTPDYVQYYPPVIRVLGVRRTAAQSLEKLVQQLTDKGVLSEAEAQTALR